MATVFDVAANILSRQGPMSAMKLQKLVYYAQAWSLVWDELPLFDEPIEAWANGPVVRSLYDAHRGRFLVEPGTIPGNPDALDGDAQDTIEAILAYYGDRNPQWLSDLTHMEAPWREARKGLEENERGNRVIELDAIAEYYGSLQPE